MRSFNDSVNAAIIAAGLDRVKTQGAKRKAQNSREKRIVLNVRPPMKSRCHGG